MTVTLWVVFVIGGLIFLGLGFFTSHKTQISTFFCGVISLILAIYYYINPVVFQLP